MTYWRHRDGAKMLAYVSNVMQCPVRCSSATRERLSARDILLLMKLRHGHWRVQCACRAATFDEPIFGIFENHRRRDQ